MRETEGTIFLAEHVTCSALVVLWDGRICRMETANRKKAIILISMFMFTLTGCAGHETLPESTTEKEQIREKPEAAEDAETEEEEEDTSFCLISPEGEQIEWAIYSEGIYCYSNGSRWGYLSESGEEITPCIYETSAPFSEGLACVRLNGKYGYIGRDGKEVIPFQFDQAVSFREGAAYYSYGEEYGLIDHGGNVILDLTDSDWGSISSFREGLAYFSVDGLYGYVDKSGEIVIDPVYHDAGYFYDGLAEIMKNGLLGLIGKDGREVLSPNYNDIWVEETSIIAQKEDIFYCFDKDGKEVFSGSWDNVRRKEDVYYIEKDHKKGLADQEGNIILEPDYMEVDKISGKEEVIVKNEDEMYGVVDFTGQVRVPFMYSFISDEEGGLKVRKEDGEKEGLLDKDDFSVKIPVVYDRLYDFAGGKAVAELDEKYGVVRCDGTMEMPVEYDEISLFSDGTMYVRKGTEKKLTDHEGNLILSGYGPITKWGEGYKTDFGSQSNFCRYWNNKGILVAVSDYYFPDSAYGAENSYVLDHSILIRGEEHEKNTEQFLLTNQITPGAGLLFDYLKTGSLTTDTVGPELTTEITELLQEGIGFSKLYRVGDEERLMLYFFAQPWQKWPFQKSDSGLFTVVDGQVNQVLWASECGGSLRGDELCFWYDTKESKLKPGVRGSSGGWGGFSIYRVVYGLKKEQAVLETSFGVSWEEEMEEYAIRGKEEVSEEEYGQIENRYRCYMPIDHDRIW